MIINTKKVTLTAAAILLSATSLASTADTSTMGAMSQLGKTLTLGDAGHKFLTDENKPDLLVYNKMYNHKMKKYTLGFQHDIGHVTASKTAMSKMGGALTIGVEAKKRIGFGKFKSIGMSMTVV